MENSELLRGLIEILYYILGGLGTGFLLVLSIVGYFLKRLINKVDKVQETTTSLDLKFVNISAEVGFVKAEIKNLKERIDKHDTEQFNLRDRLKALENYMEEAG